MRLRSLMLLWSSALIVCSAAAPAWALPPSGDPILHWNHVALEVLKFDCSGIPKDPQQGGPTRASRAMAMVHAAMFDAFNSIDGSCRPYLLKVPFSGTASPEAAVATAAHLTLKNLFPRQSPYLDEELNNYLSTLPNTLGKTQGQLVGKLAGNAMLLARMSDGKKLSEAISYRPKNLPGYHRVDPMNPNQGFLTCEWGLVRPFVIKNTREFMIPPPPALTSQEYADAFNEVKSLGAKNSTERTEEQTIIGIYWGYDGTNNIGVPPRLYNQIVRVIAEQQNNTPRQNARLFALVNLSMADAAIAAWDDKYDYQFWRPIVAIREADAGTGPTGMGDHNPNTAGDVSWEPLGAPLSNTIGNNFSPPFPAYASGHATFGAATFQTLIRFYGTDNIPFDFMSDEYNGVTTDNEGHVRPAIIRHFDTLIDAMLENAISRIYLGVHWRFDAEAGMDQGLAIGNHIFETALQPIAPPLTTKVAAKSHK